MPEIIIAKWFNDGMGDFKRYPDIEAVELVRILAVAGYEIRKPSTTTSGTER